MEIKLNNQNTAAIWILGVLGTLLFIVLLLWGWPQYKVWQQGLSGQAELKRAEQTRKIMIEGAKAERESAAIRAEAIEIIGKAAQDYPEYRQQEFMGAFAEALKEGIIEQIMYIPTEANIPITEANRLK